MQTKWSYEDTICPDLYLILPNLEEHYARDKMGVIQAGLEIQKYLKRSAKNVPSWVFDEFKLELKRLGYYSTDSLINGSCGDNTKLLDSYLEVEENVPDWFKEYPLVLIDHDCILGNGCHVLMGAVIRNKVTIPSNTWIQANQVYE